MYQIDRTVLSRKRFPEACEYCEMNAALAKNLYNAALFRVRQIFTGWDKEQRSANEAEVFLEVECLEAAYPDIHVKHVVSYKHLEKLMRVTGNPDFFAGLPMQTAQSIVRQAVQDFRNWLAALKAYKADPSKFTGKPRMPGYKKSSYATFSITNQDAVLYPADGGGTELKLPRTKQRIPLPHISPDAVLREVKVKPYYDSWLIMLTFDVSEESLPAGKYMAGIDFGVENIVSMAVNDGSCLICKGGALKSNIRLFHKEKAEAVGIITKGHEHMHAVSKHLDYISRKHSCFMLDELHKISTMVVNYCKVHHVGTLVLGANKGWKDGVSMGGQNNQAFTSMPITRLREMIAYKAILAGIAVIEQEESYTSASSFLDGDFIPVYGVNDAEHKSFSGKRVRRGLYRSADGTLLNADINAAANILRKAVPDAFQNIKDFSFLKSPEVVDFKRLNTCMPVKGIEAA